MTPPDATTRLCDGVASAFDDLVSTFGVAGVIRLGVHAGAIVFFGLKVLGVFEGPLWLSVLVHLLNVLGLFWILLRARRVQRP